MVLLLIPTAELRVLNASVEFVLLVGLKVTRQGAELLTPSEGWCGFREKRHRHCPALKGSGDVTG